MRVLAGSPWERSCYGGQDLLRRRRKADYYLVTFGGFLALSVHLPTLLPELYGLSLAGAHVAAFAAVATVAEECIVEDIPLVVETVSYPLDGQKRPSPEFAADLPRVVIQTAREVASLPIDVLKAEFPADPAYEKDEGKMLDLCRQVTNASPVPWVVLSGGVDYQRFLKQVEIACRGGASGYLAGRAVWQEAVKIQDQGDRRHFLETTAADRLKELSEVAGQFGTPWRHRLVDRIPAPAEIPEGWHRRY